MCFWWSKEDSELYQSLSKTQRLGEVIFLFCVYNEMQCCFFKNNKNLHFLNFRSRCRTEISDFTAVLSSARLNLNFPILKYGCFSLPKIYTFGKHITSYFCTAFSQSQSARFAQGISPLSLTPVLSPKAF